MHMLIISSMTNVNYYARSVGGFIGVVHRLIWVSVWVV